MDVFARNLRALQKIDSPLAHELENVVPNANLEVFIGQDSTDINIFNKSRNVPLFEDSSVKFNVSKINEFNIFSLYPYLYFFGLGNGVFYKLLLSNAALKRLIIIEPDIELIFCVLNLIDFAREIEDKRLILLLSKNATYETISPYFYQNRNALMHSKLYDLHIFNEYYEIYANEVVELNRLFINIIEHGVVAIGNDSKDAIIGIKHHIANLPLMLQTPSLLELIKHAKNTDTAVIVSTGPSLHKQLPLLKKVVPYVSIFCIDASFPILARAGIKPDIVLTMERVEESARFYEETPARHFKDVIFAITSIAHEKLIQTIIDKGGILQLSMRPFGYTSYFELSEYGYIGIGMSAANMAYELIVHSGFERCVFIGQDLAFGEDGTSHAKGAVYGENEIKDDEKTILLEKYGGGGFVRSTRVWKLFLNFFIKDIYDTKDRIRAINATEGGARIKGTIEMPFKDAMRDVLKQKKDKIILRAPDSSVSRQNLAHARAKIEHWLSYGARVKADIEALFLRVVEQTEKLEKLNKENELDSYDFSALDGIFDDIEKIRELFSNKDFICMFHEATQAYIFHQEMELAKITTTYARDEMAQNIKKTQWLFAHKGWLFSLAGCIDAVLFCLDESFKKWNKL